MKRRKAKLHFIYIIIGILTILSIFFSSAVTDAHALGDEAQPAEAATFEELKTWLNEHMSTGGTVALTQDITIPAEESYTFTNGRYRQEITIETQGHTIYVEGYLDLWPYLTIRGDGSQQELLHVCPGGELRLTSICIDAGENGVVVLQEEGSFFLHSSEEGMGLPEFSCTGQIISSQTTTAAAYWYYNLEELPVIRIPDGGEFTPDMLPSKLLALINRDNGESEEEVPVIWDENTFPSEQKRALVQGSFADGYTQYGDYAPRCLVVWESEENPFFLNVYLEQATEWYDMVFLYGETPQAGTVSLQSSDDGETWRELTDTDGYEPITAGPKEALMWMLSYSHADSGTERPRYYRMVLLLEDGTECYSEALELTDDFFFTAADIEGGRGGETSPNEGDDLLPENGLWGSGVTEEETPSGSDTSPEEQPDQEPFEGPADAPVNQTTEPGDETGSVSTEDPVHSSQTSESTSDPQEQDTEPSRNFLLELTPSTQSNQAAQSEGSEPPSQFDPPEESEQHSLSQPSEGSDPSAPLQPSEESDNLSLTELPDSQPSAAESTDGIQPSATPACPSGKLQILIGSAIVLCILIGSIAFSLVRKKK